MNYKEEIIEKIRKLSGKYSVYAIFSDWIQMLAIAISNTVDIRNFNAREKEYLNVAAKYTDEELSELCKLNALLTNACEEKMEDVLGYIYMHLEISSARLGQFFTPYHICQLMARLTEIKLDEDGLIRVNEPSCGGGANIIAFAERLKEQGINYQEVMRVTCQDLDWKGVYMCYVQCSMYGIPAVVVQGDTLQKVYTGEYGQNVYITPTRVLLGGI